MRQPNRPMVIVDPTHHDGESSVTRAVAVSSPGAAVVLAMPVTGPAAKALRDYAAAESLTIAEAAAEYARQIRARLATSGLELAAVTHLESDDLVQELLIEISRTQADAVILPGGGASPSPADRAGLLRRSAVAVIDDRVVPAA
jgi:hypothetical protein